MSVFLRFVHTLTFRGDWIAESVLQRHLDGVSLWCDIDSSIELNVRAVGNYNPQFRRVSSLLIVLNGDLSAMTCSTTSVNETTPV